jgi:hypothetical protein
MECSTPIKTPVAIARPRGAPRLEAFSPKLDRRVMFYRRAIHEQLILIEADPAAIAFCERPGYVQAGSSILLISGFAMQTGRSSSLSSIRTMIRPRHFPAASSSGVSMPVQCVPRIELVAARAWIDNWQRMLPCITATRRLVSPTMSTDVERFLRPPAKLVTIEREFSTATRLWSARRCFAYCTQDG